jgi:hypothetical protein
MVRLSCDRLEDCDFFLLLGRPWPVLPKGDFAEAKSDAGGGEECLKEEGPRQEGYRQEGFRLVSMMARQSKVGGVWVVDAGGRSDEAEVGDEPEGEVDVRGLRGCQGEPLRGRNRCRGMVRPGGWGRSAEPRLRAGSGRRGRSTMNEPAEPDPDCRAKTQTIRGIALCEKVVEGARLNAPPIDV